MAACWPIRLPPTQKAVLISLADNANDDGECWPSIPTICMRTCFSERAVHRAIADLEAAGALVADRSNGRHTRYVLTPANLAQPPQEVRGRTYVTPANAAANPRISGSDHRKSGSEPPQEVRSNRKEPSLKATGRSNKKTTRETTALDYSGWPSLPSESILAEWLAVRKRKKAVPTQGVIDRMGAKLAEAGKLGYTVDECLAKAVDRNWQGFEPSWLEPKSRAGPLANGKPSAAADFRSTTYTGTPYDELPPDLR